MCLGTQKPAPCLYLGNGDTCTYTHVCVADVHGVYASAHTHRTHVHAQACAQVADMRVEMHAHTQRGSKQVGP